jgi:hypothetical protein
VLEGGLSSIPQVADATTPGWLRALVNVMVDPRPADFDNLSLLATYERPLWHGDAMTSDEAITAYRKLLASLHR